MRTLMLPSLAILVMSVLVASNVCRADVAVIRPLPDQPPPDSADLAANQAVLEALQVAQIPTISAEDAKSRLLELAQNPCLDVDCAGSVLKALGADMLVAVIVGRNAGQLVDVVVGLMDAEGRYVNAEVPIEKEDVASATRAAIARALTKWPVRGLIPVRVDGTPAGATVVIDGQPRGVLPVEVRLQPGDHVVTVATQDQQMEKTIAIAPTPGKTVQVHVVVEGTPRDTRKHIIGGAILGGVGLGVVAASLLVLTGSECKQHSPDGTCVEERSAQTGPLALWTGAGALALAGGVAWLAVGIRRARHSRLSTIDVALGPATLQLKGKF